LVCINIKILYVYLLVIFIGTVLIFSKKKKKSDIIRTFTWDKKLESWVKESGFLGGGGKEPTIVSPRQYKNRFREAMDRYLIIQRLCIMLFFEYE